MVMSSSGGVGPRCRESRERSESRMRSGSPPPAVEMQERTRSSPRSSPRASRASGRPSVTRTTASPGRGWRADARTGPRVEAQGRAGGMPELGRGAVARPPHDGRGVTGERELHAPGPRVDDQVAGGHEVREEDVLDEADVDDLEDALGTVLHLARGVDEHPRHRHEDRGRRPVARGVRHEDAEPTVGEREVVVVVAARPAARGVVRRDREPRHRRPDLREEAHLDRADALHLLVELAVRDGELRRQRTLRARGPLHQVDRPRAEREQGELEADVPCEERRRQGIAARDGGPRRCRRRRTRARAASRSRETRATWPTRPGRRT